MPKDKGIPNFFIVGAARCGTTSLFHYLSQHPEIGFPKKKEPKYFSSLAQTYPHCGPGDASADSLVVRDKLEYRKLFSGLGGKIRVGDASSDTLYFHERTANSIYCELGDIPIVVMLRNPISRTISAYNNMLKDQREPLSFEESLEAEPSRLAANWDWMWAYQKGSMYADSVKTFKSTFSQVGVFLQERLEKNPQRVLREIYSFLGVDTEFIAQTSKRYSPSGRPRSWIIRQLSRRDNRALFWVRQLSQKLLPRWVLEGVVARSLDQYSPKEKVLQDLKFVFRGDTNKLKRLLGDELSEWE